jgi:hypothetical protein
VECRAQAGDYHIKNNIPSQIAQMMYNCWLIPIMEDGLVNLIVYSEKYTVSGHQDDLIFSKLF